MLKKRVKLSAHERMIKGLGMYAHSISNFGGKTCCVSLIFDAKIWAILRFAKKKKMRFFVNGQNVRIKNQRNTYFFFLQNSK